MGSVAAIANVLQEGPFLAPATRTAPGALVTG